MFRKISEEESDGLECSWVPGRYLENKRKIEKEKEKEQSEEKREEKEKKLIFGLESPYINSVGRPCGGDTRRWRRTVRW